MWITISLFLPYSYVSASVQCENCSHNDKSFPGYPKCRGPLDQSGSGSGHHKTWAWSTLQLVIREIQYVLLYIAIHTNIDYKQQILVFLLKFSVALLHNTTGITTATTMAAGGGNGPLAPHMRPYAPPRCFK